MWFCKANCLTADSSPSTVFMVITVWLATLSIAVWKASSSACKSETPKALMKTSTHCSVLLIVLPISEVSSHRQGHLSFGYHPRRKHQVGQIVILIPFQPRHRENCISCCPFLISADKRWAGRDHQGNKARNINISHAMWRPRRKVWRVTLIECSETHNLIGTNDSQVYFRLNFIPQWGLTGSMWISTTVRAPVRASPGEEKRNLRTIHLFKCNQCRVFS